MKSVSEELQKLIKWKHFCDFHAICMAELDPGLKRFLTATMDEVRTSTSTRVALSILKIMGLSDAGNFREAVLRRELLGTIAYPRQRDHSSHTLYNYLLGWYFVRHCPKLEVALTDEFKKRGVPHTSVKPFQTKLNYFGCVWQYASLLHDIGYAFEGGLSSVAFEDSIKQAEIGARVAREYFNRQAWLDHDIDVEVKRSKLVNLLNTNLRPPAFDKTSSLAEIANELRSVGDLTGLMHYVVTELDDLNKSSASRSANLAQFTGDAFDLWTDHYEFFDNTNMARRIQSVRKIFNRYMDRGMPGPNIRLLDHGVCGGLLQLLASTYHYRLSTQQHSSLPRLDRNSLIIFLLALAIGGRCFGGLELCGERPP
jgi:hypothetical protein